jgi:hypothetical protein
VPIDSLLVALNQGVGRVDELDTEPVRQFPVASTIVGAAWLGDPVPEPGVFDPTGVCDAPASFIRWAVWTIGIVNVR